MKLPSLLSFRFPHVSAGNPLRLVTQGTLLLASLAALYLLAGCATPLDQTIPKASARQSAFQHFITARGDQLMDGDQPYRFVSLNIPNLLLIEDNVRFDELDAWRFPNRFEVTDALTSVRQIGGTVVRTYVISVLRTNDAPTAARHVLGPGKFNEEAFRALDMILQVANETGVRVIIPLVDNWPWMGGVAEYAGFRGKPRNAFWTDPQIIADFKETVRFVLTRTNTLTGVPYREDKAVFGWELGNELRGPPVAWTREMAAFFKSLDARHLVIDGQQDGNLHDETLAMPEVNVVSTHHYPGGGGGRSFAVAVRENAARAKGKKPYFVGEFGFVPAVQMEAMLDTTITNGVSGALLWSLRYRNRDGGFYWHSEPDGANQYNAYHWPGFASGNAYEETKALSLLQRKAHEIRGLPMPAILPPAPPQLLPIANAAAISWQGSVGATTYRVERAPKAGGPWVVAGDSIDETAVQYRPLFSDTTVTNGNWFYRVQARNQAGLSKPSNVVGPVKVTHATLVDEMRDFALTASHQGQLAFNTRDTRKAKEDAHRLGGRTGDAIVYHLAGPISSGKVFAYFAGDVSDFRFAVSADGQNYSPVTSDKKLYFQGTGDYGYWKPVLFQCQPGQREARYLRIEFGGEAQIGRIEIEQAARP